MPTVDIVPGLWAWYSVFNCQHLACPLGNYPLSRPLFRVLANILLELSVEVCDEEKDDLRRLLPDTGLGRDRVGKKKTTRKSKC